MITLLAKIANYKLIVIFVAILLCYTANAQKTQDDFVVFADSLIEVGHKNYTDIDYAIYKKKYDTLKMRVFEAKSIQANYPEGEAYANIVLGNQYRNKSLFKQSAALLNKALEISKVNNLVEFEVVSLNMLGVINRRQDNIRAALNYHHEALTLAESQPKLTKSLQKSIAVCHNSMGNIYLSIKQYDLALDEFKKSLTIEQKANNKLGLAINYHNIGIIYEAEDKLDKALENYKISLEYNESINSDVGRVICKNSIGAIYLKQNKPKEALDIIQPTIELAEKIQDQFYISSAYLTLGSALNALGKLDSAKLNLEKGLAVAESYNFKSGIASAKFELSDINQKLGNINLALNQFKEAVNLSETITNEKTAQYVNTLRFQYEAEKKNSQIQALASENEIVKLKLKENKKTWLFALLGFLLFVGIVFAYSRQRQLKNEKKILTLEQDMLRSQMNPHFIFNSLNSIKLYIINNEKENAVYYLNKFSKLIRKILVASTEKDISLAEEIETMNLYMNIENIRFSNEINYTTQISDSIQLDTIKVPSLILQPFLENALWHGLSSKKGNKNIVLNVEDSKENYITITITDNGIGRKASAAIKDKKLLKRKSVGIDLTKERLTNFYKGSDAMFSIIIEDLYDSDEVPIGTKVVLNIPIVSSKNLRSA
ncbi:tetratricopeptide repeat-containing sensor histidine kinase [Lacinutrix salivirga]